MFSRLIKSARGNTALTLTARFALLFMLSGVALFTTANYLLERSQLERDQQLIDSFIESYQRLEASSGLSKLELVVSRDIPYFQRSEMLVLVYDEAGNRIIRVAPDGWPDAINADIAKQKGWFDRELTPGGAILHGRAVRFQSGWQLVVARAETQRQAQLEQYRQLVLLVMVPLMVFGLLLTAYMNWRALRPVHDLINTVSAIRENNLQARVEVRNPDSELGELAQLFNSMLQQIERLVDSMRHSLDAVAHDLRTPLSRMRLSLEHALASDSPGDAREALLDCAEESERIATMLRALMELAEAENGMLKLHREPISLRQTLCQCVELYRYLADEKGVSIQLSTDSDCELVADRTRLLQLVGNLLDNAIKYTESGGSVELSFSVEPEGIQLCVADTGIGIAPEDQPLVFDRLYRADQSRSEPGMGLGLALVKAVVKAHEGEIRLRSEPGQGSCFCVSLPLANP